MDKNMKTGVLVSLCGKMGAGKSHNAKVLAKEMNAVLLSEDSWLAAHYPSQITDFSDYLRFSELIRPFIKTHVQNILQTGTSVVMDFPANTARQRAFYLEMASQSGASHRLIYVKANDALCLRQIEQRRREQPERAAFDTEQVFHYLNRFFEEPRREEGMEIEVIQQAPPPTMKDDAS